LRVVKKRKSASAREGGLAPAGFFRPLGSLVGNPITSEDLHHVLCRSHYGRYIQTDVNSARNKPFFLDVVAGKPNGKDGTNDRDGFKEFLYDCPTNSAFDCLYHRCCFSAVKMKPGPNHKSRKELAKWRQEFSL
jgi:hypothetical protein